MCVQLFCYSIYTSVYTPGFYATLGFAGLMMLLLGIRL